MVDVRVYYDGYAVIDKFDTIEEAIRWLQEQEED